MTPSPEHPLDEALVMLGLVFGATPLTAEREAEVAAHWRNCASCHAELEAQSEATFQRAVGIGRGPEHLQAIFTAFACMQENVLALRAMVHHQAGRALPPPMRLVPTPDYGSGFVARDDEDAARWREVASRGCVPVAFLWKIIRREPLAPTPEQAEQFHTAFLAHIEACTDCRQKWMYNIEFDARMKRSEMLGKRTPAE